MIKLTVRYDEEAELTELLAVIASDYHVKVRPRLSKPATKRPGSEFSKREIWLYSLQPASGMVK
jgi:hypothetical protein